MSHNDPARKKHPKGGSAGAKHKTSPATGKVRERDLAPLLFPIIPFLFYIATCCRTIGLGDTALLMMEEKELSLTTEVNNHNFTVLLGRVTSWLPLHNNAFEANLASAVGGAIAISVLFYVIHRMTRSVATAAITACVTMVSHSMWWHSTIAEVYALNALFMFIGLGMLAELQRRYSEKKLLTFFFVCGLAFFQHVQLGILLAGACTFALVHGLQSEKQPVKWILHIAPRCLGAFALGFIPYLVLLVKDSMQYGFFDVVSKATGGQFHSIMFKANWGRAIPDVLFLIGLQFPGVFLVAIVAGIVLMARAWRRSPSLYAIAVMFVVNTLFFMTFDTWDRFAFLLPSFLMLSFAGSFAVDSLVRRARGRPAAIGAVAALAVIAVASPIYLYAHTAGWARDPHSFWHQHYNSDYTANNYDTAEYIANPNRRNYRGMSDFVEAVFRKLPRNAVLIDTDSRALYQLRYVQVYENQRPDIKLRLFNSWGFSGWGVSPEQVLDGFDEAIRLHANVFITTLDHPFKELLAAALQRQHEYHFEKYPLDDGLYIYRLQTP
jgi:hypothetical protein